MPKYKKLNLSLLLFIAFNNENLSNNKKTPPKSPKKIVLGISAATISVITAASIIYKLYYEQNTPNNITPTNTELSIKNNITETQEKESVNPITPIETTAHTKPITNQPEIEITAHVEKTELAEKKPTSIETTSPNIITTTKTTPDIEKTATPKTQEPDPITIIKTTAPIQKTKLAVIASAPQQESIKPITAEEKKTVAEPKNTPTEIEIAAPIEKTELAVIVTPPQQESIKPITAAETKTHTEPKNTPTEIEIAAPTQNTELACIAAPQQESIKPITAAENKNTPAEIEVNSNRESPSSDDKKISMGEWVGILCFIFFEIYIITTP
jgi:hypothetical protein